MKSGLLWYDANPQTGLQEKVARAAQRYRQRLGQCPSVCYVHPGILGSAHDIEVECRLDGDLTIRIRLAAMAQVLPHHFWLSEDEEAADDGGGPPANHREQAAEQAQAPQAASATRTRRGGAERRGGAGARLQEAVITRAAKTGKAAK